MHTCHGISEEKEQLVTPQSTHCIYLHSSTIPLLHHSLLFFVTSISLPLWPLDISRTNSSPSRLLDCSPTSILCILDIHPHGPSSLRIPEFSSQPSSPFVAPKALTLHILLLPALYPLLILMTSSYFPYPVMTNALKYSVISYQVSLVFPNLILFSPNPIIPDSAIFWNSLRRIGVNSSLNVW